MSGQESISADGQVPEGDYLEQQRPLVDEEVDGEAPVGAGAVPATGVEANEADVLEQSLEVDDDDVPVDLPDDDEAIQG